LVCRYGDAKAHFLFNKTCEHIAAHGTSKTPPWLCEVGFNAGHTALLWLELAPSSRVVSFDLGDLQWSRKQAALLTRAYGADRFEIVWGSSLETAPAYDNPSKLRGRCSMAFLDGGKTKELRIADLRNFERLSAPGALLLFDEATSLDCVRGLGMREEVCGTKKAAWGGTTYAYHTASRDGLIEVSQCSWPPALVGKDGVCAAKYVSAGRAGAARPPGGDAIPYAPVRSTQRADQYELTTGDGGLNVVRTSRLGMPQNRTCPRGERCRVIILSSLLVAGHKNTHYDGSFGFFTSGKLDGHIKLVRRFLEHMSRAMRANQSEHEMRVVTDFQGMPAQLYSRDGRAKASLQQVEAINLPPIDSRYHLYLHLLQQLRPSPSDCIFAVDLADVEMLASPRELCLAHPEAVMIESGPCNGKDTGTWQRRIASLTNWSASRSYQAFLHDPKAVRLSAGIHGGTWRTYKPFLLEMVGRIDHHWLTVGAKYGFEGLQNSVDMMVINEIPLMSQQLVLTGYPFGPLNMPQAGRACNTPCVGKRDRSERCEDFNTVFRSELRNMLPNYFFAHKRSLLPGKPLY